MNSSDDLVHVLVVDDDRDIRDGCERVLSRIGCRVTKSADGEAGLAALDKKPVDVVLLDLKMPGLDGLEVLYRINESYPDILVIIITGYATVETAIEAMKLGAYDFIPKPFNPDQLRITVDRAIERKRLVADAKQLELERQKTLVDLDTEKSRTRTIIRALPNGVAVTAPDGRVVLMNPAFCRQLGLAETTRPGEHISSYLLDQGACDLVLRVSGGEDTEGEETPACEFATPEERYLMARCTKVTSEEGELLGAVMVLMDVTDWKMLDRLKTELVARVSHELRSPLSTIDLQLAFLLGDGRPDEKREDRILLERAKEKTQSLIFLIRDLLDISRAEWGMENREVKEVRLEEVLRNVVASVSVKAQERNLDLTLELPEEGLPALTADPVALESTFSNLVTNAINYTQDGGSIEVKAYCEGAVIKTAVRDNGFGIEAEDVDKIFERFYRVKSEKTRYINGTGLGLPIVKGLVESMGGQITVESEIGQGSTFTVLLPTGDKAV